MNNKISDSFGQPKSVHTYLLIIPVNEKGALERVIIYALKDITVQELCKWPEVGPAIIAIIYIVMEHYGMIMEIPSKALFASPMFLNQLTKRIEDNRKTVTFDI